MWPLEVLTSGCIWWHTEINPEHVNLRQEDREFKASLSYLVRQCLKNPRVEYMTQWYPAYLAYVRPCVVAPGRREREGGKDGVKEIHLHTERRGQRKF